MGLSPVPWESIAPSTWQEAKLRRQKIPLFSNTVHLKPNLAKSNLLGCAPVAAPSSYQFFNSIQYLCGGLYLPMHCKIELTAECNPTLNIGQNAGYWPFSAIFAIFAGFEEAMRSHGPADRPAGI